MTSEKVKYMTFSTPVTYTAADGTSSTKKKIVVVYYESHDPAFINIAIGAPFDSEPTIGMNPFREDFEKVFNDQGNYIPEDEEGEELSVTVSKGDRGRIYFQYSGGEHSEVTFSMSPRQAKKLMKIMVKLYPFDDHMDVEPEDF